MGKERRHPLSNFYENLNGVENRTLVNDGWQIHEPIPGHNLIIWPDFLEIQNQFQDLSPEFSGIIWNAEIALETFKAGLPYRLAAETRRIDYTTRSINGLSSEIKVDITSEISGLGKPDMTTNIILLPHYLDNLDLWNKYGFSDPENRCKPYFKAWDQGIYVDSRLWRGSIDGDNLVPGTNLRRGHSISCYYAGLVANGLYPDKSSAHFKCEAHEATHGPFDWYLRAGLHLLDSDYRNSCVNEGWVAFFSGDVPKNKPTKIGLEDLLERPFSSEDQQERIYVAGSKIHHAIRDVAIQSPPRSADVILEMMVAQLEAVYIVGQRNLTPVESVRMYFDLVMQKLGIEKHAVEAKYNELR